MADISDDELVQLRAAAAKVGELERFADIGRRHMETETARISKAAAKLPAADRALIEGEADLARASQLLERLTSSTARPGSPGGAPLPRLDFASSWGTPAWEDAKRADPDGARRWLAERTRYSHAKPSPLAALLGGKK